MRSGLLAFAAASHPTRPSGLAFRPVTEADWPFLGRVYAESRAEELAPAPWPQAVKDAFLAQQFELQKQHYQTHYAGAALWVVCMHAESVGRVYVYRSPSELRLMDIALLTAWRGRGLGRAMLAELLDEADQTGKAVSLHVEPGNAVLRLYRREGFEQVEERGAYLFMRREPRGLHREESAARVGHS